MQTGKRVESRPGDPLVTPALIAEHGLTSEEYDRLVAMLGRAPTFTELGIVSALWSEHCSYKHSRPLLKTLPTTAPYVLQGPGENAGVIAIGDGLAVAFKIESHNHPSAVEPYQGAATGVGGILRDVFTMGARPVALLNSLRFGSLDSARVRYLFAGVVKGIGDYGNCVGVPTVAGEVSFDPAYEGNPIVNAMCVGVMRADELMRAVAQGVGNPIIAVGARTGRDGIHGASFASEDLSAATEAKRPRVQVGDPFTEKLLLEASLELIRSGAIVAIQDMGAAGLTSSSAEMAARGDVGVTIDTTLIPVREEGMTPYEILLSESQERMLVVAKRGRENEVRAILEKWDLTAAVIGEVIAEPVYRVTEGDRVVAEFPGTRLVTDCPTYTPDAVEGDAVAQLRARDVTAVPERPQERDLRWTLEQLLSSPTISSKTWVHRQYDTMVRTNTVVGPGGDAAVLRLRGTQRALALKTDCNGRYVYLDPRVGTQIAVCEAARNVACTGARPLAITNNLNFGNPRRPEVYFQLREAIAGMAEACRVLGTPVTGGNVSLYNENPAGAVYPTPVIGMVGLIDSLAHVTRSHFQRAATRLSCLVNRLPSSEAANTSRAFMGWSLVLPRSATSPRSAPLSTPYSRRLSPVSFARRTIAATADSRSPSPSAASSIAAVSTAPPSICLNGTRYRLARCCSAKPRHGSSSRRTCLIPSSASRENTACRPPRSVPSANGTRRWKSPSDRIGWSLH